jgi:succinate dehydrogenase / fumarate reductase cytochrome b subunit
VYANLVVGLQPPLVAAGYLAASALLGLHLHHGLWSFGRSLGWRGLRRSTAATLAAVSAVGFASIPAAVLVGVLR